MPVGVFFDWKRGNKKTRKEGDSSTGDIRLEHKRATYLLDNGLYCGESAYRWGEQAGGGD